MGFLFKNRDPSVPSEVTNWRLWYATFVFGLMGAARGVDEGLIGTSAEHESFRRVFNLDKGSESEQADRLGNLTSMVQMGSILGAIIAFYLTDKIGRLWATRQLCLVWAIGIAIYLGAGPAESLGMAYAGRFIAGVGIGQTTVVGPTYLAEVAPSFSRGLCVTCFSGAVYLGIMLAYFAQYGSSIHIDGESNLAWQVPTFLHLYFAAIIFTTSLFAIESPRWLIKVGKHERANANLSKLRGLPAEHWYVQSEILDVNSQLDREREATLGSSWLGPIKELVMLPSNRYRLSLSVFSQLLSQWSGANSITIYATEYFAMVGLSGESESLFATAIFGIVKLFSSLLCAFFLIDFIGRKRSLMTGISLQLIAMLYMAIFLVLDTGVGNSDTPQSSAEKHAATGAIVFIYISGFGWALGWNSIQYLINSEIYPLRLRAIGSSFAMTFHFVNQYANTKAVPSMFLAMTHGGTMLFFVAITAIGLAWVWFFLPELANKSLESVDAVFDLPWYLVGRKGKELTRDQGGMVEGLGNGKEKDEMMENVEELPRGDRRA